MKLIVITTPHCWEGEAERIAALFDAGLEILHLRKPDASREEMERLLRQIPARHRCRIVLHEHFPLAVSWGLKGIHLNRRNPEVPAGYAGQVSRSCHSLEELVRHKPTCHYLFLSPIYDSISKQGYDAAYTRQELQEAQRQGIIGPKVMALGGISARNLPEVKSLGFGGAALLGDIWKREGDDCIAHFLQLKRLADGDAP